jgi:hypothetical protein
VAGQVKHVEDVLAVEPLVLQRRAASAMATWLYELERGA